MLAEHHDLVRALATRVAAIAGDPVLRRSLRYEPSAVVASWAPSSPEPAASLGVRHLAVPAGVDERAVLGPPARPRPLPLPLRLVRYGIRPAGLFHGSEADLAGFAEAARRSGMFAIFSPWDLTVVPDPQRGGFTDLAGSRLVSGRDPAAWRALLVTPSPDLALMGWLALLYDWDVHLGLVLGYPPCCASAFVDRWHTATTLHAGDVAQVLLRQQPPGQVRVAWQCNTFARVLGAGLPVHFPCRLDCSATSAQVDEQLAMLGRLEPDSARALVDLLRSPLRVTPTGATQIGRSGDATTDWFITTDPIGERDEVPQLAAV